MTQFHHYDSNGVYDLRLSTGDSQTLVVTDRFDDHIKGYVAETHRGMVEDPEAELLKVDDKSVRFKREAIIGKSFVGGYHRFDVYEFPHGGPAALMLDVPEDAREGVDFEYKPVTCPGDDPEVDVEPGSCNWSGDFRETAPGDRCPSCGTDIPDPADE